MNRRELIGLLGVALAERAQHRNQFHASPSAL
jgi:hypothetical protein